MNPRIPILCGPLFRHPSTPSSLKKITQPPTGLVTSLCPPKYLNSAPIPSTDLNNRPTPLNSPTFYPMTPSLKQDGNRRNTAETSTWKITAKTMVHENPCGRLSNDGTATDQIRTNTDQPNTKNDG